MSPFRNECKWEIKNDRTFAQTADCVSFKRRQIDAGVRLLHF